MLKFSLICLVASLYLSLSITTFYNSLPKKIGALLLSAGAYLNALVMLFNGFRMPVLESNGVYRKELIESHVHKLLTEEVQLWFLADIIELDIGSVLLMLSLGDLVIFSGLLLFSLACIFDKKSKTT